MKMYLTIQAKLSDNMYEGLPTRKVDPSLDVQFLMGVLKM